MNRNNERNVDPLPSRKKIKLEDDTPGQKSEPSHTSSVNDANTANTGDWLSTNFSDEIDGKRKCIKQEED